MPETNAERLETIARDIKGNLLEIIEVLQQKEDLAERVQELEAYCLKSANFINQVELEKETARLREALEFYAAYQAYYESEEHPSEVMKDYGKIARQALVGESDG